MPNKKKDIRGELVEGFKLTPEQMDFQKKFKMLKQMQEIMQARSLGMALQMENERDLWERLENEFRTLRPPQEGTMQLPGQNFPEEGGEEQPGGQPQRPPYNLRY